MNESDTKQIEAYLVCLESCLTAIKAKYKSKPPSESLSEVIVMKTCLDDLARILEGPESALSATPEQTPLDSSFPVFFNVLSLRPETVNWWVKVKITEKSEIKQWNTSKTRGQLFHVMLEDTIGSIRCTMFDDAVDAFYRVLHVGQEYEISKGKIRKSSQPATYEMSLTTKSSVVPAQAPTYLPPTKFAQNTSLVRPTFITNPTFVANTLVAGSSSETSSESILQPPFEFPMRCGVSPAFEINPSFESSIQSKSSTGPLFPSESYIGANQSGSSPAIFPGSSRSTLSVPDTGSSPSQRRSIAETFSANPAFAEESWDSSSEEEQPEAQQNPKPDPYSGPTLYFTPTAFSRSIESLKK